MASCTGNDDVAGIKAMRDTLLFAKDLQNVIVKWNIKK